MIQVDVENTFNNVSQTIISRESCDVGGGFNENCPLYQIVLWCSSFIYYQHGQHVEEVTIIESSSNTRPGDPIKDFLFALAHYQALLQTIA
jgi:hypothetical protein